MESVQHAGNIPGICCSPIEGFLSLQGLHFLLSSQKPAELRFDENTMFFLITRKWQNLPENHGQNASDVFFFASTMPF